MLLIRLWIRMNKNRITARHIVHFIFIVSNEGGVNDADWKFAVIPRLLEEGSIWVGGGSLLANVGDGFGDFTDDVHCGGYFQLSPRVESDS